MDSFAFIIHWNLLYYIGIYRLRDSAVPQIPLLHCTLKHEEGCKMPFSELFTYRPWFLVRNCAWFLQLPVVSTMLMNGQAFWDITLCDLVNTSSHRRFGRAYVFIIKHTEALRFSEPSLTIGPRQGKACQDIYIYQCSVCAGILLTGLLVIFWLKMR